MEPTLDCSADPQRLLVSSKPRPSSSDGILIAGEYEKPQDFMRQQDLSLDLCSTSWYVVRKSHPCAANVVDHAEA